MYKTKRERLQARLTQLKTKRQPFEPKWQEIGELVLPMRLRFLQSETDQGDVESDTLDSTATEAAGTLEAGFVAGVTPATRPWFRLGTSDPDLGEIQTVKEWLHTVTRNMTFVISRSNLYQSLSTLYADFATFGTAALYIQEDTEYVIHSEVFPVGSFWFSTNGRGRPDTFAREISMTVKQIVTDFCVQKSDGSYDLSNLSTRVKLLWEEGKLEQAIDVVHQIGLNPEFNPKRLQAKYKRFESCYYETHNQDYEDKYLRESGYDRFPVLIPRWKVTGQDAYGTSCPGMRTLPEVKQLQVGESRGLQALELMISPPMVADPALMQQDLSILPSNVTFAAEESGTNKFRPAFEVRLPLDQLEAKQEQLRRRILKGWFADLFRAVTDLAEGRATAEEIRERVQEKFLQLGPVLGRLDQELLNPMIDLIFDIMRMQSVPGNPRSWIPEPPEELEGQSLKVEYIGILAQAQKSVAVSGIERLVSSVIRMAAETGDVSILDKLDFDQSVDELAESIGVSPRIVRSDEKVQELRDGRAQAQAQAQRQVAMREAAATAKDFSQADTSGENALTQLQRMAQAGNLAPQ